MKIWHVVTIVNQAVGHGITPKAEFGVNLGSETN
jgi:hypothetical protein